MDAPAAKGFEADSKRVVDVLRGRGVEVESVYDLVNTTRAYPEAIAALVMLLGEVSDEKVKEGVIRALSVKEARGIAAPALIAEFHRLPLETGPRDRVQLLKWTVGNALAVVATASDYDQLAELVRDSRHGAAREMLPLALARTRDPRAVELLTSLLSDHVVAGHALQALRRLKIKPSREAVTPLLDDPRSWVRREAKAALG